VELRVRWRAGRCQQSADAGAAFAVIEVADLQLDLTTGWAEAVLGHGHGRALADDVTAEPEPADALQLQAHTGRLDQGTVERCGEIDRLEDEELDADAAGVGRQPAQERFVGDRQARRQVQDEQIHRAARDERTGKTQPLPRLSRSKHDEPAQVHATSRRLERVEGPAAVQPGHDAAGCLRLGDGTQCQRRLAR